MSPHLQIYRPTITMAMSFAHRLTGAALYLGTLLVAWWLIAVTLSANSYAVFQGFLDSWPGQLILFGYIWALIHHMLGGLRHLLWDFGIWIDLPAASRLAWATLIGSTVLATVAWMAGHSIRAMIP
ncbi:Succinate dehydrogenase cytochrome b-556 subunit [Sphingobium indicum BiD32]|uniref:Succinate dehydrogenase cytochrome b556 subunit n=2 Tax=Sphingobium indicum TaxID=332055 RepID=N1MQN5_9SPHN|nr:Succinate dehydrogenase cytochrome b-556 subunit [Sphingobium indicum BiD32]